MTLVADSLGLGDLLDGLSELFQIGKGASYMKEFVEPDFINLSLV